VSEGREGWCVRNGEDRRRQRNFKIKDEEDGEGRDFLIKKRKNIYWWGFQSNHIIIITLQNYSYNYKLKEKKICNYNFIRNSYKIDYQITDKLAPPQSHSFRVLSFSNSGQSPNNCTAHLEADS
jgi:hypothetical protein